MSFSNDPWEILRGSSVSAADLTTGEFQTAALSIYQLLRTVGIIGVIVTLLITLIKFTAGSSNIRAEAKSLLTKKIVLAFFLFTSAYFFGYILAVISNL
jgi:hypothetical protein